MKKRIIIIGAGISGLCAGSYLQMNGYNCEIFELHDLPGGLCTSWKRGSYLFDGCIHSLGGVNPDYKMYNYWNELIDMEHLDVFFFDELVKYEDSNGLIFRMYNDLAKLENELKKIAPMDINFIESFVKSCKKLSKYDTTPSKPMELWNFFDYYKQQFIMAPIMKDLIKWRKSMEELTEDCKSPVLKRLMNSQFFSHYPAYFFVFSIGYLNLKKAGYPIGGSLHFARLLENKFLELGGKIHYNSKVQQITVEDDKAIGVVLDKGEIHNQADYVISASDGHNTIFKLLNGKYINKKVEKLYKEHPVYPSVLLVYLGVSRTFENESPITLIDLKKPLVIDDRTETSELNVTIYNFDPTLAPKGKTCIRVIFETFNFEYWSKLKKHNKQKYQEEKNRIARSVIDELEHRFGNLRENVEVIDVATPATLKRYTNNWKGSSQGWEWTPGLIPKTIKKQLPGLKNFYLIGQWVMPGGGVPAGLLTGRDVARIICKKDKKKFRT